MRCNETLSEVFSGGAYEMVEGATRMACVTQLHDVELARI
jgi:hypothetical protein